MSYYKQTWTQMCLKDLFELQYLDEGNKGITDKHRHFCMILIFCGATNKERITGENCKHFIQSHLANTYWKQISLSANKCEHMPLTNSEIHIANFTGKEHTFQRNKKRKDNEVFLNVIPRESETSSWKRNTTNSFCTILVTWREGWVFTGLKNVP